MPHVPTVSVVLPTYNRAHTLKQAIDSVLTQTAQDWELLIIDDGSTDDTKQLVTSIQDPRITYFYKQNGGPGRARNFGIEHAKAKWVMYLDSDDSLLPDPHALFAK